MTVLIDIPGIHLPCVRERGIGRYNRSCETPSPVAGIEPDIVIITGKKEIHIPIFIKVSSCHGLFIRAEVHIAAYLDR